MASRFLANLTAVLCLAAACLTTALRASAATAPVAYVYVADGESIHAYSTQADGSLTSVQTLATPNHLIWHLSVTKKFLYGIDGGSDISMFAIGPNGALTSLGVMSAAEYDPGNCFASGVLQVDETGSNLYTVVGDCEQNSYLVSFKILPTGQLAYLGRAYSNSFAWSQIRFTANNLYAFETGCYARVSNGAMTSATAETPEYKRESNGYLTYIGTSNDVPQGSGGKTFCPFALASHGDQLVFEYLRYWPGQYFYGTDSPLGVYTVSSDGKLSTESNYSNMASSEVYPSTLSVSPSGAVLATAGDGAYQFFHFNGANQPVKWTGPLSAGGGAVEELGWDKADHFYALTETALIVYHVTATSYKQEAGLPNAFTNAASLIVLSLD